MNKKNPYNRWRTWCDRYIAYCIRTTWVQCRFLQRLYTSIQEF